MYMPADSPVFVGSSQATSSSEELTSITQEMYKQNLELTVKNKTLSVLRTLSTITLNSLGVAEVSQKIADAIVSELKFATALLALIDDASNELRFSAISQSEGVSQSLMLIGKSRDELHISMKNKGNLMVDAILDKERKITGNLLDVFLPLVSQEIADKIENLTHVKTVVTYPLFLGPKALGVLSLGLAKRVDDLSRAERETIDELIDAVAIAINRAQLVESMNVANEQLTKANSQLELLDKLKDEFVSVASHELRTPMTAIKSYTWLVLNGKAGPLEPKAKEYINRVYLSTERLIHLVNEMLDVSRIESGRVKLAVKEFDPAMLLSDIQNEFQARANENGITLTIEKVGTIAHVNADSEKIQQVLENLVGNAMKFTPKGGSITMRLSATSKQVIFDVIDTGAGIPSEDMPKLFHKFGRLENSLVAMKTSSTGLGLYISKQYVELHGGTIKAQSTQGHGSTFTFTIPIR